MKILIFIILLFVQINIKADYMSADQLLMDCSNVKKAYNGNLYGQKELQQLSTCTGYIMGFVDNEIRLRFTLSLLGVEENIGVNAHCFNEALNRKKVGELAVIYVQYLNEHPKELSKSASTVLVDALNNAYQEDVGKCVDNLSQIKTKEKNKK